MPCLDDATAVAFARGALAGDALDAAIAHVDGCAACRRAIAAAAGAAPEPDAVAPATTIGRFAVEGVAGAGAMGIVYRARDPRLDRVVALKVIRPDALAPATRARFEREARALARVSHPNVVAIHEVGDADGAIHLAMEHLPGGTLADWLRAGPHPPRAIVDKLVAAGEGLLAAHQAGLVHRDFKPANVLLDAAGRVRVTDFGLAHDGGELDRDVAVAADADLLRTRTGMIVGTPAYMAPEQHDARLADPRSDQFAFAVTLYEALAGHRPFRAADYAGLVDAVRAGRVEPPARPIPRPLWRAIRRALAPRAEDRFPSMRELLDALIAWGRPRRARWIAAAAVVAVGGAAAVVAVRAVPGERAAASPCAGADARWRGAFGEGGAPAFPGLVPGDAGEVFVGLERLGADWVAAYLDTCAPGVDPRVADLRRACLDDALVRATATVGAPLGPAGADQARGVIAEAQAHLARCVGGALAALASPPEAAAAALADARAALADAAARRVAGDHAAALAAVDRAVAAAEAAGYAPTLAEAWLERALVHRAALDAAASVDASHRAIAVAQEAGHHAVARRAAENAAWQHLFGLADLDQAARWVGVAEQLDDEAPPTPWERALREIVRAHVDEHRGDLAAAIARLERVDDAVRRHGLGAEPGVRALEGLVLMLYRARRFDEVAPWLDRLARAYPDDPRARFVEARQRGSLALLQGRAGDGVPDLERAVALATNADERAGALVALGEALAARGDLDAADARLTEALAIAPDGRAAEDAVCTRGRLLHQARRWAEAAAALTRCLEAREASLSAHAPVVIFTMVELGTVHHYLGRGEVAVDYLDRALARFAAIGRDDDGVSAVRWTLAQILHPRDPARAVALAAEAERKLASSQPDLAATIARWRAARTR